MYTNEEIDEYLAVQKRENMRICELEDLNNFCQKFADRQYGLDCGGANIMFGGNQIYLWSHGSIDRAEWIECGNELVDELDRAGLGNYEVYSASEKSCTLLSK